MVDGEVPVHLCNYTDVYYNEQITADLDFMEATASPDQCLTFQLQPGDVLLTKDSETPDDIGVCAVVAETRPRLLCGYHLALIRPRSPLVEGRYLRHALASSPAKAEMTSRAMGITRYGLRSSAIGDLTIPLPVLKAQRTISDYLDRETARIDAVIEMKQRAASLAKERLIAAVEAEMSVGDDIVALRRLATSITTGSRDWSDMVGDGDGYFVRAMNLRRGATAMDLGTDRLGRLIPPTSAEARRARLAPGDVVVCVTGYPGSIGYWDGRLSPAFVSQHVAAVRPKPGVAGRWLSFALLAPSVQGQIEARQYGGTKQGLGLDDLKALRIKVPSSERRERAAAALEKAETNMLRITSSIERQINLLEEKRQALITAAVTGQIVIPRAA
jgi:type I restriction enzyme S subunit